MAAWSRSPRLVWRLARSRLARWILKTASALDTVGGSTARASTVALVSSGIRTTQRIVSGRGTDTAMTPAGVSHDTVRPPWSAAATLSGCPSARAARARSAARSSGVPATALAPSIPPIHAAALDPSPRLSGIAFTHSIATPVNRRPAASKSVRAARATMLASVAGSWPRPSPRTETVTPSASASVSSLYRASASPSASKPGPRLAEVAGTRTCAIIGVRGPGPPGYRWSRRDSTTA